MSGNTQKELSTIDYYDRAAQKWAKDHGGDEGGSCWRREMEKFQEQLTKRDLAALWTESHERLQILQKEDIKIHSPKDLTQKYLIYIEDIINRPGHV